MSNCKVIALTNQKGGVGKTTTAVNLGVGLAKQGKKVLLIDADAQANLTMALGYNRPDDIPITFSTVMQSIIDDKSFDVSGGILHHGEGVDLLPSNIELSGFEVRLINAMSRERVLKTYVNEVRKNYDYVLIDCMPSLGMITINALAAADSVIIPTQPHYLSAKGLELLLRSVSMVKRQINPKLRIDGILITMVEPLVIEAIRELVSDKSFAKEIKKRFGVQTDTSKIDKELANYESKLKEVDLNKARLEREIDNLPADAKYRERKIHDMTIRLDGLYDTIVELEERIEDAKLRRSSIEMEAITLENVYRIMENFSKLYAIISDEEKKSLVSYLIKEIQIYPNGTSDRILKAIEFNFPIYRDGREIRKLLWENGTTVETVCLLSKLHEAKHHVNVKLDMDEMDITSAESKATYEEIKKYVAEHNDGMKVTNLYIAQVKKKCGIIERENYNKPKSEDEMQPQCPKDKEKAIEDALRYFQMK